MTQGVIKAEEAKPMALSPVGSHAISVNEIKARKGAIKQLLNDVFQNDVHFGTIPGTQKPTLLQPGAQDINQMFCFRPRFTAEDVWHPDGHYTRIVKCVLVHFPTGTEVGEGDGICSTREKKYRYRQAERVCPSCGKQTIIKGKAEYGGGWICFAKKGGCGSKWGDGAPEIEKQQLGQIENPDIADMYNTVCKMADKRALVAATLNTTGASDTFTQDVEDFEASYASFEKSREQTQTPAPPAPEAPRTEQPKPPGPPPPPAQPAPEAPKQDAQGGAGAATFVSKVQIDALLATVPKLGIQPNQMGTVIQNLTGQKPESASRITKVQYQKFMAAMQGAEEGAVTFDRDKLAFVFPT